MPPLKKTDTESFIFARQQLHRAIQIPAAAARSFLPYRQDDSYASLEWLGRHQALASQWFGTSARYRMALRLEDFTLLWLDSNLQMMSEYPLPQRTVSESLEWTKYWLEVIGLSPADFQWEWPYTLPAYPTSPGNRFEYIPEAAFSELASYFSMAEEVLKVQVKRVQGASPLRCWPHHFDFSTRITLQPHKEPDKIKSVSAGLSPGDNFYPEPYCFITPWPYPDPALTIFPDLGEGSFWHQSEWVGSVLPAAAIVEKVTLEAQTARVQSFFNRGIAEITRLVL